MRAGSSSSHLGPRRHLNSRLRNNPGVQFPATSVEWPVGFAQSRKRGDRIDDATRFGELVHNLYPLRCWFRRGREPDRAIGAWCCSIGRGCMSRRRSGCLGQIRNRSAARSVCRSAGSGFHCHADGPQRASNLATSEHRQRDNRHWRCRPNNYTSRRVSAGGEGLDSFGGQRLAADAPITARYF